ncbi:MAG: PGRS family protein [Polyangiaceae bacterium]|nr:PGRS family protein [Polyangiaceae bacterium]
MKRDNCRALASVGLLLAAAATTACSETEDCSVTGTCPGAVTTSTWSGQGGGSPDSCDPFVADGPIPESCGLWVSSSQGNDGNYGGFRYAPTQSLREALERVEEQPEWKTARIYVCAEDFPHDFFRVPAGATVYGGMDCTKEYWPWLGGEKKSRVRAPADVPAAHFLPGEGKTWMSDLEIVAPDALDPGESSIAALVDGQTVELTRVDLTAGDGQDGATGEPGDPPYLGDGPILPALRGENGLQGDDACDSFIVTIGGAPVQTVCPDGSVSISGKGGNGEASHGNNGEAAPVLGANGSGLGGLGQPSLGAWDCDDDGGHGHDGENGVDGAPGPGAVGLGVIGDRYFFGVTGGDGQLGTIGKAGGGGGAMRGSATCAGAAGGSGGAGACGGKGGHGGKAGGSSIALAMRNANVTLTDCNLKAGNGARGGTGGEPQPGGTGGVAGGGGHMGPSGSGLQAACHGGRGGNGGMGGPGGGGHGGHSFAIAYQGAAPIKAGTVTLSPGNPGQGGLGGLNNVAGNVGENGKAAEEQELPSPAP